MSIVRCHDCDRNIDLDYDDEHVYCSDKEYHCSEEWVHEDHEVGGCYECKMD